MISSNFILCEVAILKEVKEVAELVIQSSIEGDRNGFHPFLMKG